MDPTDILIKFKTEADTAGAVQTTAAVESTTVAVDQAEDATRKLQQAEDLAEAKRRVSARSLTVQSGEMKNLGNVANQVGFQITDFAVQVQGGQSAITALSQQLPQAIGAIQQLGTGVGGLSGALSSAVGGGTAFSLVATELAIGGKLAADAYVKMSEALRNADNAIQNFKNSMVTAGERLRSLEESARSLEVADAFKEGTEEAKKFNAELERSNRLRQAQQSLAETTARISGAGPAELAALAAQGQADQLQADLRAAEARKTQAQEAYLAQTSVVNQARAPGQSGADLAAAEQKLKELEDLIASTTADVVNLAAVNTVKLQEAGINATQTVSDAAEAGFTGIGTDLSLKIQELAAKPGAIIDESLTQARASIAEILSDSKITLDEIPKLEKTIRQLAQSSVSGSQETQGLLTRTLNQLESLRAENNTLSGRLSNLEQQSTGGGN